MQQLPIFLNLQGRTVLIVGQGDAAEAKARLVTRAGASVVRQWQSGVTIAFVALDDDQQAADTAESLRGQGLLVNVVDRPQLCDFTTPAIIDRAPVTIAVGTAGASAGLAKAVRQRIEALLPPRLGDLASALFAARAAIKARWPDAAARRRAIDAALAANGTLDPLRPQAADHVSDWLHADAQPDSTRLPDLTQLKVIRLTSLDPDDLTLRSARLMGEADHIFHSSAIPPAILHRARADAVRHATSFAPTDLPHGLSLWIVHPDESDRLS